MARISRSSARLIRRGKPTYGKSRRKFPGASRVSSCAGRMVGAPWPVVSKSSRAIRIGGSSSCFTNISMAIMAPVSAPATRRAGPAWLQNCWSRAGNESLVSRRGDSPKVSGREIHKSFINFTVGLNTLPISGRAGRWEMEIHFSGKVALVAGGTGGLGRAGGLGFLGEGAAGIAPYRPEKGRSGEHTSEIQALAYLVFRLLL